jgi:starvation-inducible DNA-binding protein
MNHATSRGTAPRLATPTDLGANAAKDIAGALNGILADSFALYLKTKNFHWHISGPHFRNYHLLLDEQAEQIFATTDVLAERVRKIGQPTLRSIGDISRQQRLSDNDAPYVEPQDMLAELRDDNQRVVASMRKRTTSATSTTMSRARACWRPSSMTPRSASGFSTKQAARATRRGIELLSSWPGMVVRRTACCSHAYVPAISLRKARPCLHKRDAWDKPAHDG